MTEIFNDIIESIKDFFASENGIYVFSVISILVIILVVIIVKAIYNGKQKEEENNAIKRAKMEEEDAIRNAKPKEELDIEDKISFLNDRIERCEMGLSLLSHKLSGLKEGNPAKAELESQKLKSEMIIQTSIEEKLLLEIKLANLREKANLEKERATEPQKEENLEENKINS